MTDRTDAAETTDQIGRDRETTASAPAVAAARDNGESLPAGSPTPGDKDGARARPRSSSCPGDGRGREIAPRSLTAPAEPAPAAGPGSSPLGPRFHSANIFEDLRDDDCGDDLHPPWRRVGRGGRLDAGRGGAGGGAVPTHLQNGSGRGESRRDAGRPTPQTVLLRPRERAALGLLVDQAVSWRPAVTTTIARARSHLHCLRCVAGSRWGTSTAMMLQLYSGRPTSRVKWFKTGRAAHSAGARGGGRSTAAASWQWRCPSGSPRHSVGSGGGSGLVQWWWSRLASKRPPGRREVPGPLVLWAGAGRSGGSADPRPGVTRRARCRSEGGWARHRRPLLRVQRPASLLCRLSSRGDGDRRRSHRRADLRRCLRSGSGGREGKTRGPPPARAPPGQ
uniref:Uncharacterized protein n=1 Tax=Ixodes ricinus TaxID=34613 RepID=A0A6B0V9U9_IXORI